MIDADGSEVIAVRRSGLTPVQKRALAIYDNRTAELAEWNPEQLSADLAAGLDLKPWFSDKELAVLFKTDGGAATSEELPSQYLVLVTCHTEQEQLQLLERFSAEGIECKALVS